MITYGHVVDVHPSGNSLVHLERALNERSISASHTLELRFACRSGVQSRHGAAIRRMFLSLTKDKSLIDSSNDTISWRSLNKEQTSVYYTDTNYGDVYVKNITQCHIRKVHANVSTRLKLQANEFQVSVLVHRITR